MLYSGKVYDFEKRVGEINAVTLNDVFDAINFNFDESKRACAIVGAVDKPL